MSRPGQGAESPGPVGVPFGQDREPPATGEPDSLFSAVGGEETFRRLVSEFYAGVSADPVLRPLYPEDDLGPAEERLRMFLVQFWGGPRTYSQLRGHPRLRLRHAPFPIGVRERDAWLSHMRRALDHLGLDDDHDAQLWAYFVNAAEMLRNAAE